MFRNGHFKLFAKSTGVALVVALALLTLGTTCANAATIYACVNNSTGAVIIVSATHVCSSTQHKISWNQTGPQGPPGVALGFAAKSTTNVFLGSQSVVLSSPKITKTGYYWINATALLRIDSSDFAAYCFLAPNSTQSGDGTFGGSSAVGFYQQAAIADFLYMTAGDYIDLICRSNANDASTFVFNAGLNSFLVQSGGVKSSPIHAAVPNANRDKDAPE